jgi:hydrogenase nickel incorporation protein HypB
MCATCGCSDTSETRLTDLQTGKTTILDPTPGLTHEAHPADPAHQHDGPSNDGHHHDHEHEHHHAHDHSHTSAGTARGRTLIAIEQEVLGRNDRVATWVRGWLAGRGILALNLVSSPGAGKTTLLERTIRELGGELAMSVIEGDQQTLNDAQRIQAAGCRVVQINTGRACHLDAAMVARALEQLDPPAGSAVLIENVGNLVCPALFDLGERAKVAIVSVTEGEDKPVKYPHMFRASRLLVLNKVDLLPYVAFDVDRCLEYARQVNPHLQVIRVSATTGEGLADWYDWLRGQARAATPGASAAAAAAV